MLRSSLFSATTASVLVIFLGGIGQALSSPNSGKPTTSSAARETVRSLTINWRANQYGSRDNASADLGSLGRINLVCNPDNQSFTLTPARSGVRTVVAVDRFSATDAQHDVYASSSSNDPVRVPLPANGMFNVVISQQPISGSGGSGPAPVSLMLSSEYVTNDDGNNLCFVAAQAVQAGR